MTVQIEFLTGRAGPGNSKVKNTNLIRDYFFKFYQADGCNETLYNDVFDVNEILIVFQAQWILRIFYIVGY